MRDYGRNEYIYESCAFQKNYQQALGEQPEEGGAWVFECTETERNLPHTAAII